MHKRRTARSPRWPADRRRGRGGCHAGARCNCRRSYCSPSQQSPSLQLRQRCIKPHGSGDRGASPLHCRHGFRLRRRWLVAVRLQFQRIAMPGLDGNDVVTPALTPSPLSIAASIADRPPPFGTWNAKTSPAGRAAKCAITARWIASSGRLRIPSAPSSIHPRRRARGGGFTGRGGGLPGISRIDASDGSTTSKV
jgi:hypothetical protein